MLTDLGIAALDSGVLGLVVAIALCPPMLVSFFLLSLNETVSSRHLLLLAVIGCLRYLKLFDRV